MAAGEISRGIADIKVYPLSGVDDTMGTGIDVPGARALTWQAEQDSEPWEGDDTVMATAFNPKQGTGTLAVGRANGTAMAAYLGGTAVVSGSGGTALTTYEESGGSDVIRVAIVGQAKGYDVSGSAYRVTFGAAVVASPAESMQLNQFNEPSSDITFQENADGLFIRRQWYTTLGEVPTDSALLMPV